MPDGEWMQVASRCNIFEQLSDQSTSVGDMQLYIAGADSAFDIYLDDIQVDIWVRENAWIPLANMRINEFRRMQVNFDVQSDEVNRIGPDLSIMALI